MKLWCLVCHTLWTEGYLSMGDKCPFKDCEGRLSPEKPSVLKKPVQHRRKKTWPLLEGLE